MSEGYIECTRDAYWPTQRHCAGAKKERSEQDGSVAADGCTFFFQAEDGIRSLVRSRGLGVVYKGQVPGRPVSQKTCLLERSTSAVPYTHLTLPTILRV